MNVRARRDAGFTLLEVVVSIALFSMLMVALYSGFTTAVSAYEAAGQRSEAGARMRVVSGFLRRSLEEAYPIALSDRRGWSLLFDGSAQRLRYAADLPGYLGFGGMHEIVVEVVENGSRRDLVMRRRPFRVGRDGAVAETEFEGSVLLEDVSAFELRYFGSEDERDEDPRWREAWSASRRMPELIELRIVDAGGTPWPTLTVRTQVDAVRYQGAEGVGTQQPEDGTSGASTSRPARRVAPRSGLTGGGQRE